MTKALITGKSGFTGGYLSEELQRSGYSVYGLDSKAAPDTFCCDLLDKDRLNSVLRDVEPDYIYHLAGIAFIASGDAKTFQDANVLGTLNLLEVVQQLKKKPKAILLISSANVYGNTKVEFIDELIVPNPVNDYSRSKLEMEHIAKKWMDSLPIVIVRPFNYTGVGQDANFLIPKIVQHYKKRADYIELGNLEIVRDFSDVRDVVHTYRMILESVSATGQVLNVCSEYGYSLSNILNYMNEISGHQLEIKVNPQYVRENEIKRLVGSRLKLNALIGKSSVRHIKDTLSWMYDSE